MGDVLRPLRFLGSVLADNGTASSGQSTRQDRVGGQRDQYGGLETSSEKSRRCSGFLLKNIGSTLRVMGLSADQLTSMLMYEVLAVFKGQASQELHNEFTLKHTSGTALVGV